MRKDLKVALAAGVGLAILIGLVLFGRPGAPEPAGSAPVAEALPAPAATDSGPAAPPAATAAPRAATQPVAQTGQPPTAAAAAPSPLQRWETTVVDRPPPTPAPKADSVDSRSAGSETLPTEHTVVAGDNLTNLAIRYYGNAQWAMHIARANPALQGNPNRLLAGTRLLIPKPPAAAATAPRTEAAHYYRVKPSDTLRRIAQQFYGDPARYKEIFQANTDVLTSPDHLRAGMLLRIPSVAKAPDPNVVR